VTIREASGDRLGMAARASATPCDHRHLDYRPDAAEALHTTSVAASLLLFELLDSMALIGVYLAR
jgi:hypothetical protein